MDEKYGEQCEKEECWDGECGKEHACACGSLAEYFGPDPYTSEMCQTYQYTVNACKPGDCTCWDAHWMCWDCHNYSYDCL